MSLTNRAIIFLLALALALVFPVEIRAECKSDPATGFVCKGDPAHETGYVFPPKLANDCRQIGLIPELKRDRDLFRDQRDRCTKTSDELRLKLNEQVDYNKALRVHADDLQRHIGAIEAKLAESWTFGDVAWGFVGGVCVGFIGTILVLLLV